MLTITMAAESPTKTISILDWFNIAAGSKYLKGEKYFRKSSFEFKAVIIEKKYVIRSSEIAVEVASL